MKRLLFVVGFMSIVSAADAAKITIHHYNGTGESVSIANGINCSGGWCNGDYSLRAGQTGTLTNNISGDSFSLWYGYRTRDYPYNECGGAVIGSKSVWEDKYDVTYYNRGTNCTMSRVSEDTSSGIFTYRVNQRKY